MAPRAAASQLGATLSFGGLSASAMAAGSPSIRTTTAILLAEADMFSSSAGGLGHRLLSTSPLAGEGREEAGEMRDDHTGLFRSWREPPTAPAAANLGVVSIPR